MKIARTLGAVLLLAATLLAMFPGVAAAQDEISINALYPTVEATAGGTFEFEIELMYSSVERVPREFQIKTIAPAGWDVSKMDRNSQMPTFNTGSKKDNSNSERDISDGLVRLNRTDDDDEIFSSPGY